MKEWPEDPIETVDLEDLVEPIVKSLLSAYDIERKSLSAIPYSGYNIGGEELISGSSPEEMLRPEDLRIAWQNGKMAYHALFSIAVQLGIEQGRRLERKRWFSLIDAAKTSLEGMKK